MFDGSGSRSHDEIVKEVVEVVSLTSSGKPCYGEVSLVQSCASREAHERSHTLWDFAA
jgi:hypothetical protein